MEKFLLDDVDRQLLTALQADGRLGYGELGELVGLTAGGVRKRVKRLEDRGILQIVGVTDPMKLGYSSMAMVGITARGDVERVADALDALESVIYVVVTGGRYDLMAEVVAEDNQALFEVINAGIRAVEGVEHTETFQYYGIRTHRFGWGTR